MGNSTQNSPGPPRRRKGIIPLFLSVGSAVSVVTVSTAIGRSVAPFAEKVGRVDVAAIYNNIPTKQPIISIIQAGRNDSATIRNKLKMIPGTTNRYIRDVFKSIYTTSLFFWFFRFFRLRCSFSLFRCFRKGFTNYSSCRRC